MHPVAHIRQNVFRLSQTEFGEIAGVTQPTVCRWEKGVFPPDLDALKRIRKAALQSGVAWDDSWFFELPSKT